MSDTFKPYYAVIFTSVKADGDNNYEDVAKIMIELVAKQEGFMVLNLQEAK